jgi:hypothetical protein
VAILAAVASKRQAIGEMRAVARAATPTHQHLRERLAAIAIATLGVDAIGSVLEYFLERHAPGTRITNFGDAVFWTTTQLLTVSSQLPNPLSTGGRIVDVFLQAWAISVVAALAGSFGAFFHRRGLERHPIEG